MNKSFKDYFEEAQIYQEQDLRNFIAIAGLVVGVSLGQKYKDNLDSMINLNASEPKIMQLSNTIKNKDYQNFKKILKQIKSDVTENQIEELYNFAIQTEKESEDK